MRRYATKYFAVAPGKTRSCGCGSCGGITFSFHRMSQTEPFTAPRLCSTQDARPSVPRPLQAGFRRERGPGVAHCAGAPIFWGLCEPIDPNARVSVRLALQDCSFDSKADDATSSAARPFAVSTILCLPCCLASGGSAIRSARASAHSGTLPQGPVRV